MKKRALIVIIFVAILTRHSCSDVPSEEWSRFDTSTPSDQRAVLIALKEQDFENKYALIRSKSDPVAVGNRIYPSLLQNWEATDGSGNFVTANFAVTDNPKETVEAVEFFRKQIQSSLTPSGRITNATLENGRTILIVQGNAIAVINASESTMLDRAAGMSATRMSQEGFQAPPALSLSPRLIQHAIPGKQPAIIECSSSDNEYSPMHYASSIRRSDNEDSIASATVSQISAATAQLLWDGTDYDGNPVESGEYVATILLVDSIGRMARGRVEVQVSSITPVTLQLNVLSKHVKPHKNEQARVQATATNPPTTLSYSIYRGGQGEPPQGPPVLTAQGLPAPNGALELVWDGTDASGQRVANGSYVMVVTARDSTGHEASSSAHLVVNFQGGAQGARSLWQLASPAQRWLSPSDALRLAFPIPCLGAELAGSYLFSPEQLSSTVHRQRAEPLMTQETSDRTEERIQLQHHLREGRPDKALSRAQAGFHPVAPALEAQDLQALLLGIDQPVPGNLVLGVLVELQSPVAGGR